MDKVKAVGVRVVGKDGKPVMAGSNPSDGGGLKDHTQALQLANEINARRERRERAGGVHLEPAPEVEPEVQPLPEPEPNPSRANSQTTATNDDETEAQET